MAVVYTKLSPALFNVLILAAACVMVAYLLWIIALKRRAARLCGHYVYPLPELPILGSAIVVALLKNTTGFWNFITEKTSKYRQGLSFWVFHLNWIFIQQVDVVEAVLMSPDANDKSYVYSLLNTITDGVFSCNGLRWRKLRKKLNLTFSQRQLEMYYEDINEQTAICIDILKANTGKYVNIQSFLTTCFVDIIFRTHFGVATEEQFNRKYEITERAANAIGLIMERRFFNIFMHPEFLFKWSRLFKFLEVYRAQPLNFIRRMIAERMKQVDLEKEKGLYGESKKLYFVDLVGDVLTEMNIKVTPTTMERNTSDVIVAASDTTSVAVSAATYYLSLYPDIQEKVYQEVVDIFGQDKTKYLTKEDLSKMEYLEMVIKETLRLTCPPGIVRKISKDLDVGKYTLPKGCNAYIVMKAIHENPSYWEKPKQFYPEHFLPEKVNSRPKFSFIPFAAGPRNCPGVTFSYMTMKTIISNIVRNFKLETDIPLESIRYRMALMQEYENGFRIKLTPRLA